MIIIEGGYTPSKLRKLVVGIMKILSRMRGAPLGPFHTAGVSTWRSEPAPTYRFLAALYDQVEGELAQKSSGAACQALLPALKAAMKVKTASRLAHLVERMSALATATSRANASRSRTAVVVTQDNLVSQPCRGQGGTACDQEGLRYLAGPGLQLVATHNAWGGARLASWGSTHTSWREGRGQ